MIDRMAAKVRAERYGIGSVLFDPAQAITGRKLREAGGDSLVVLIPPRNGGERSLNLLTNRLLRQGKSVLRYVFAKDILHSDPKKVLTAHKIIEHEVPADLQRIAGSNQYGSISLVGLSLGTAVTPLIARNFPEFNAVTLVTPGAWLAHCLWDGIMTQPLRRAYEQQGMDCNQLDDIWHELAPIRQLDAFTGKAVTAYVATRDEVIPAPYQQVFAEALQAHSPDADIRQLSIGHYQMIARFCVAGQVA